jgi:hypothetical protein
VPWGGGKIYEIGAISYNCNLWPCYLDSWDKRENALVCMCVCVCVLVLSLYARGSVMNLTSAPLEAQEGGP